MKHCRVTLPLLLVIAVITGCMRWDYGEEENFNCPEHGLFIVNEGNFQYGNATLSFYDPTNDEIENEIFFRANRMRLGDVAQSMSIFGNRGWIVVNNSHVIFAIDLVTFRETGRIENLTSPRYIHFISDRKAYVTQLWDNRIFIVDPKTYSITGTIEVPNMSAESGSTEQMIGFGPYVFCNCWSYQNRIIRIDTRTDAVDAELTVGIQPNSMALDANGKLWVLTDGGYDGSPYGSERPAIYRIDASTLKIEFCFPLKETSAPRDLQLNGDGTILYWIDNDIWAMDINSVVLPDEPVIASIGTKFYGLTVDPLTNDIYVADAIDYQQQGKIYHYSPDGVLINGFYAGVTPAAFCWK